jgi:hypothetical protein
LVQKRNDRDRQPKKDEPKRKDLGQIAARKQSQAGREERRRLAREAQIALQLRQEEEERVAQIERERVIEEEKAAEAERQRLALEAFEVQQAEKVRQYHISQLVQRLGGIKPGLIVTYNQPAEEITVVDPSFAKKTPAWRKLEVAIQSIGAEFKERYLQLGVGVRLTLVK